MDLTLIITTSCLPRSLLKQTSVTKKVSNSENMKLSFIHTLICLQTEEDCLLETVMPKRWFF